MIKLLTTLLLIVTITAFAQNYEPQILILAPHEFIYEKSFEKEVKSKNKAFAEEANDLLDQEFINSEEYKKQPENIQKIILSQMTFAKTLNFPRSVSYTAQTYLSYRFYERFTNFLILLSEKKSDGSLLSFL